MKELQQFAPIINDISANQNRTRLYIRLSHPFYKRERTNEKIIHEGKGDCVRSRGLRREK